jgi:tetratricopeptide (TPR) repeat protein
MALFPLSLVLYGCSVIHSKDRLEPRLNYEAPSYIVESLPSSFEPLSDDDRKESWGKELLLGDAFAREMDLYRALTCYKSAIILLPENQVERRLQLDYNIILCYYLGHKYREAVNVFEKSQLTEANALFPAFNNLLIILYDAYLKADQPDKAERIHELILKCSSETAIDLSLYHSISEGEIVEAECISSTHREAEKLQTYFDSYYAQTLSPKKARLLNAILPGAGYYYIGQTRSAVTSFMINALFSAAAYQLFHRGYWAGGAIVTSLEMGWYVGGINGAGIEAQEFNNQLYRGMATKLLSDQKFFPVLMFETAF